jgi:hypothetical protein
MRHSSRFALPTDIDLPCSLAYPSHFDGALQAMAMKRRAFFVNFIQTPVVLVGEFSS